MDVASDWKWDCVRHIISESGFMGICEIIDTLNELDTIKITGKTEWGQSVTELIAVVAIIRDEDLKVWPVDDDAPQVSGYDLGGKVWFRITDIESIDLVEKGV